MRKFLLILFFLVSLWIDSTFSENSYWWNLTYTSTSNIKECINQTRNNTSWVKYIPITNNYSAPTSANSNLCESHWYFWEKIDWYINKNNNRSCDDYWLTNWYASEITCYDSSNNVQTCTSNWSWWVKYKLKCKYRFDDTRVELNSAPLQDRSIVADWQDKSIIIGFPLSTNNLEWEIDYIDFTFIITDNTSINWLDKNKNSISSSVVTIEDTTTWDSFSSDTRTVTYHLDNWWQLDSMKSGDKLNFIYKFYNPTEVASDIFPAIVDWFIYKTITYDIKFNDGWTISWYYVENKVDNVNINGSTIPVRLTPLIQLTNTWVIFWSWLVEWNTQTWELTIVNNNSSVSITSTGIYMSMTWSNTKPEVVDYFTWSWNIDWWTDKDIDKDILVNNFINILSNWTKYLLETLFTLVDWDWTIDDIKELRVREFIKYSIWWKTVTYLAWVLNQNNTQSFETLKIYWRTNIGSYKQKDLLDNQDANDIQNLAWNITKASLKRDIRKRAINTIKFVDTENITAPIKNIDNDSWNSTNWWKVLGAILYYEFIDWSNAVIWDGSQLSITWKKTLIVRWWNLRITQNIINTTWSDILWIIVLKWENWLWGKVYIDSNVDEVDAIIYADKSIIWYNINYDNGNSDTIIKHEIDWNINNDVLDNQLYIYWSIFTENTIWASRLNPPVCPFWTIVEWITCNTVEAQKYDFNYLRTWLWANPNYTGDPVTWLNYPIVIKYNSAVQSTPPPLFGE